jgi:hypothetical protein
MRVLSLDALRGYTVLLIVLFSYLPFSIETNLLTTSWVNMPLLLGLFCVGATFPFALERKLPQNFVENSLELAAHALVLAFFAVFLQHIKPDNWIYTAHKAKYLIGFSGFLILFLIFGKFPSITGGVSQWVKMSGYAIAFLLLYFLRFPDGSGFSIEKKDSFLWIIAFLTFVGGIIWLLTHNNWQWQAVLLGAVLLANTQYVTKFYPNIPFLQLHSWKYLLVTIPGMIAGDILQSKAIDNQVNTIQKQLLNGGILFFILGSLLYLSGVLFSGYCFGAASVGFFGLLWFEYVVDSIKKRYFTQLFIENGQNVLLIYTMNVCLVSPFLIENPMLSTILSGMATFFLAFMARFFTRKNIFWKS